MTEEPDRASKAETDRDPNSFEEIEALLDQIFAGPCSDQLPSTELKPLREHIEELAAEHQIDWNEQPIPFRDAHGSIARGDRSITTPILTSELGYLVALHEIGHVVLELPSHDDPIPGQELARRFYENEATVWEWALDESRLPLSADAAEKIPRFLYSDDPGESREEAQHRVRAKLAAIRQAQQAEPLN